MYQQYVPVNRLQRSDHLVEEQIRARLAKQQYLQNVYERNVAARRAQLQEAALAASGGAAGLTGAGGLGLGLGGGGAGLGGCGGGGAYATAAGLDLVGPGGPLRHLERQKVVIAANRLPVTLKKQPIVTPDPENPGREITDPGGPYEWVCTKSSGGLVSGLNAVRGFDMTWVGWPGAEIPEEDQPAVIDVLQKHNCLPVFISQQLIDLYYNGFANNVIWPLFHYVSPPLPVRGVIETSQAQWEGYQKANELFTDAVCSIYNDDDYVWVHDYHLMLVPKMLRERIPRAKIGWFLHIPFPACEEYRMMKVREELLTGLLSANLVAFHVLSVLIST